MAYRRRFTRARRAFRTRSYNRGGFGVGMNPQFLIGLAASFLPVNIPPIANTAIAAAAVAPIKLPGGIKMGAQGYIMGKLIQQFTGNPLTGGSSNGGNTI